MNKNKDLLHSLLLCAFLSLSSTSVHAQITPDNTLGAEASKLTPNVLINGASADLINGGALRGNNLFHSFSEFNIKNGQGVYFANPSRVVNILTRVTGSNASNILGTLGVDGGANLFLINPNGILFGQNARLDIGGSFVGTTANGVQFGNQGNFSASAPKVPGLLTINPSALFFNQINPNAAIVNKSVAPVNFNSAGFIVFGLQVPDGKSLLLVGGNVSMDGGELNALGGRVELGGLAEPGTVALDINNDNFRLSFPEQVTRASVSLINQAQVHVESAGGGDITINAQNIEILGGSGLLSGIGLGLEAPTNVAGNITLNATGEIKVAGTRSGIRNVVQSGAKGNGGNIAIDTGFFNVFDGGIVVASTFGQGNAGNITVNATGAVSLKDAAMFSSIEAGAVGKGGNISINAASLSLANVAQLLTATRAASRNQPAGKGSAGDVDVKVTGVIDIAGKRNEIRSGIFSNIEAGAEGQGGNITIDTDSFKLRDGAQLLASTFGIGDGGNVKVTASNSVSLMDNAAIGSTVEASGVGKAGNIIIDAATLSLQNSAKVLTYTNGVSDTQGSVSLDAGNVNVKVTGAINIADEKNTSNSGIFTYVEPGAKGNGGNITIDTGSLNLRDGAQLSASTFGIGSAGNVTVNAKDSVQITDALILSTVGAGGTGKGGNININAASLSLTNIAQLLTATLSASGTQGAGRGNAGDVNVKVTGIVDIAGKKDTSSSGIFSRIETGAEGNGGNITIDAGSFNLQDGAQLEAGTFGIGNAGNITVTATGDISLINNALITSTVGAGGVGKGGNITINAATLSLLRGAQLQTFTQEASNTKVAGRGDAGNVNIKVIGAVDIAGKRDDMFPSAIFSSVNTGAEGNGGNITIDAGFFNLRSGAQLATSTTGMGNAGSVTVTAKDFVFLADGNIFSTVEAGGVGKGGNITIDAASLSLLEGAQLLTSTREASNTQLPGRGNAGNVNVKVQGVVNIAGKTDKLLSAIRSSVETGAVGNGGNITIDTDSFKLLDGAQLFASTFGQGNAGNVTVTAKNSVFLVNNALITSSVGAGGVGKGGNININAATLTLRDVAQLQTTTYGASSTQGAGKGDAGNVNVKVFGEVDIAGKKDMFSSAIFSYTEKGTEGNGGNITINAGSFKLQDGAFLSAATSGIGNAGNITLTAKDSIFIADKARIGSTLEAGGVGKGGNIDVNAATLTLLNSSILASSTFGQGNAGDIAVRAKDAVSFSGSSYVASTVEAGSVGKGGNIDINTVTLTLRDGAQILTGTKATTQGAGRGDAGNVKVIVTDVVDIAGIKDTFPSGIFSSVETGTEGNGGNITIDASSFKLHSEAELQTSTYGIGNAGNVTLIVKDNISLVEADIFSAVEAGGVGKGGNIDINAASLSLYGAQIATGTRGVSATQGAGRGDAGNVNVKASGEVNIAGLKNGFSSGIFSSVQLDTVGNGGDITISADSFKLQDGAILNARTENDNRGGNITVNTNVFKALTGGQLITTTSRNGRAGKIESEKFQGSSKYELPILEINLQTSPALKSNIE
ncbi:hypothetical protein DSM106972_097800 [Dulcicalothrix desertica PCC 7102]|uniref:Filamentous haemagglutinin FhaB/tRNA nuclease CdiA-like TPS domain-containing protein n=1 Tax=Dulcicalothrix desertica PCC 7102 TaxID=232991 RepID=A0A3S5K2P5_9CYAN|nr:filamentous hemagglutinin N-terminal domain-containing protein [Dulcicalothrix desertica]RUS92885.1 hypothetical protein DSM106972_097800 [Dulcicalothrix desertica PCC 7102]TWH61432.1 filamentous hemagglutinin family protein [Dulcicalothrix desertica PCC 7102]